MTELFRFPYTVRFHDADPAGIVFFANYYRIAHEAYEEFLEVSGTPLARYVQGLQAGLPIASCKADYHRSLAAGMKVVVSVRAAKVGRTSFVLAYRFLDPDDGSSYADVETVHVHVSGDDRKPTRLPEDLKAVLQTTFAN